MKIKKLFLSAGLMAAGAAGIQNALAAPDLISPKAWNVSGTLRGFYDDNYTVSGTQQGSFGVEVSPTISLNVPLQQTDMGIRYIYGLYYYQQREDMSLQPFDQTHQFEVWLDHAFNERWKLNVSDTLAIGQEPELTTQPAATTFRINGDNLSNHGNISLDTQWTRLFSTSLHYGNNFYDYDNSGSAVLAFPAPNALGTFPTSTPGFNDGNFRSLSGNGASLAGLLNRVEQNIAIDFQWSLQPETMVFAGYNFSLVNYTGDEAISTFNYFDVASAPRSLVYMSESRDSITHYGYAGVTHQFTANISGTVRAGVSYTDSYNDPLQQTTSVSPYADMSVSYTYLPGSYVQLGFTHDINSTDIAQPDANGHLTQFQESSVVYVDVNHRFSPKLLGTVIGRFQTSEFQGGANDSQSDDTYSFSVNLNYQISQHFSTEVGYNFDDLESGIGNRSFVRNRVYLGVTASY